MGSSFQEEFIKSSFFSKHGGNEKTYAILIFWIQLIFIFLSNFLVF
jgi:hypothetical protein